MVSIEDCSLAWWSTGEDDAQARVDLAAVVTGYSTLLFRVAHSVVRNAAEAEDVVQDTFLRVLQHRADLPAVREMRLWLVRIAWNLALDRRRRIRPEQMDDLFAGSLSASGAPIDHAYGNAQELQSVLREIDRLPRGERHALLLSAVEEMSTADIAGVLGRSESAVRALLFRARTRLKERCASNGAPSRRTGGPR